MKKWVLIVTTVLLFTQCKKSSEQQQQMSALPYPVVKVEKRDVTGYGSFPARIEGINNNAVRAKISGYIEKVYVDEGQRVARGQALFKLETNAMSESVDAAKAAVQVAQVEVDKLIPLVEKGIISKVQLETAKARLASVKSQMKQAQANINYSVIRSPINGIVGELPYKEGSLVGPSSPALTVVSETRQMYAYFAMNESEYLDFLSQTQGKTLQEKLKNIPEVNLVLSNGQTYEYKGKINAVTGQVNPGSGTVQFRVSFPNPQRLLANGSSGTIRLPHVYRQVAVVPETATFEQQGLVFVYKVIKDSIATTKIEIIDRVDNLALVKTGVAEGETVVSLGVGKLRPGMKINPQLVTIDSILQNIPTKFK